MASSAATMPAPPDAPNTVTVAGSPPKRPMVAATQRKAATASSRPRLAGAPSTCANPSTPSRQLTVTTTTPSAASGAAS
jgi:hypothetical protein